MMPTVTVTMDVEDELYELYELYDLLMQLPAPEREAWIVSALYSFMVGAQPWAQITPPIAAPGSGTA